MSSKYGSIHIAEWMMKVRDAKQQIKSFTELSHIQPLSDQQRDSMLHSQFILQANDKRKVTKWQVRTRLKPLMDKGCSSKSLFQGLHASSHKNSCLKVRKLDGSWTHSFSELQQECHSYF